MLLSPGSAIPGLLTWKHHTAGQILRGESATSSGTVAFEESYVEQVDRALESFTTTPRCGVREFGEMVGKEKFADHAKRCQDVGAVDLKTGPGWLCRRRLQSPELSCW